MPEYAARVSDPAATSGLILGRFTERPPYAVRRPRGASSWLLVVTVGGAGRTRFAGRTVELVRGSVVLLPPGLEHSYAVAPGAEAWEFWWAHFQLRPDWYRLLPDDVAARGLVATGLADDVIEDLVGEFEHLHRAARWPGHGPVPDPGAGDPRDLALAAAEPGWALAAPRIETLLVLAASTVVAAPALDPRLQEILAVVAADPAAPHTLTSLARAVALSPSRLSHLCSEVLGVPVMAQVRRIRLAHAATLLRHTDLDVGQVAAASGFASPFHFSRAFRARYGSPPSTYRAAGSA